MTLPVLNRSPGRARIPLILGIAALSLPLIACGDSGDATTKDSDTSSEMTSSTGGEAAIKGSCDKRGATDDSLTGTCSDYTGDGHNDVATLAQLCTNKEGSSWIAEGGCPQADLIGSCVIWEDQALEEVIYYYTTYDPADDGNGALYAESQCTNNAGAWTPLG